MIFEYLDPKHKMIIGDINTLLKSCHAHRGSQAECDFITCNADDGNMCVAVTTYGVARNTYKRVYHKIIAGASVFETPYGTHFMEVNVIADDNRVFCFQFTPEDNDYSIIYFNDGDWQNDIFVLARYERSLNNNDFKN